MGLLLTTLVLTLALLVMVWLRERRASRRQADRRDFDRAAMLLVQAAGVARGGRERVWLEALSRSARQGDPLFSSHERGVWIAAVYGAREACACTPAQAYIDEALAVVLGRA